MLFQSKCKLVNLWLWIAPNSIQFFGVSSGAKDAVSVIFNCEHFLLEQMECHVTHIKNVIAGKMNLIIETVQLLWSFVKLTFDYFGLTYYLEVSRRFSEKYIKEKILPPALYLIKQAENLHFFALCLHW